MSVSYHYRVGSSSPQAIDYRTVVEENICYGGNPVQYKSFIQARLKEGKNFARTPVFFVMDVYRQYPYASRDFTEEEVKVVHDIWKMFRPWLVDPETGERWVRQSWMKMPAFRDGTPRRKRIKHLIWSMDCPWPVIYSAGSVFRMPDEANWWVDSWLESKRREKEYGLPLTDWTRLALINNFNLHKDGTVTKCRASSQGCFDASFGRQHWEVIARNTLQGLKARASGLQWTPRDCVERPVDSKADYYGRDVFVSGCPQNAERNSIWTEEEMWTTPLPTFQREIWTLDGIFEGQDFTETQRRERYYLNQRFPNQALPGYLLTPMSASLKPVLEYLHTNPIDGENA